MEQHHNNNILLIASLVLNFAAHLTKSDITFAFGIIVSLLAIINYILEIRKKIRNAKHTKR